MSAGQWARDLADNYGALAKSYEARPQTEPRNVLGAQGNRAEEAKYRQIADDMDAAFPDGLNGIPEPAMRSTA